MRYGLLAVAAIVVEARAVAGTRVIALFAGGTVVPSAIHHDYSDGRDAFSGCTHPLTSRLLPVIKEYTFID